MSQSHFDKREVHLKTYDVSGVTRCESRQLTT